MSIIKPFLIFLCLFISDICLANEKVITTAELYQNGREKFAYHLKTKAENGDIQAKYLFGMANIERTWGFKADLAYGIELVLEAANAGHIEAMEYLVWLYRMPNSFIKVDYSKSAKWAQIAASKDSIFGNLHLGIMYEFGSGVKKNTNLAMKHYEAANHLGSPIGSTRIESLENSLNSFENNFTQMEQDALDSIESLGPKIVPMEKVYDEIKALAESGNVRAIYLQGRMLYNKSRLAVIDRDKGTELILKAAELGDADACLDAYYMYSGADQISRVERDGNEASKWMMLAADRGNPEAMFRRAEKHSYYVEVPGGPRQEAFTTMLMAAEAGHKRAKKKLGDYYFKGRFTDIDYERAAYWYLANQKHRDPHWPDKIPELDEIFNSSSFYRDNPNASLDYLNQAHELGIRSATIALAKRAEQGLDGPPDLELAKHLYWKANDVRANHRVATVLKQKKKLAEKQQLEEKFNVVNTKMHFAIIIFLVLMFLVTGIKKLSNRYKN